MTTPTVGRIVQYTLSDYDAQAINTARLKQSQVTGVHTSLVGNYAEAGQTYPAMIVRVWGDSPTAPCNLQLFLDGSDTHWVTSRSQGEGPSSWRWPSHV